MGLFSAIWRQRLLSVSAVLLFAGIAIASEDSQIEGVYRGSLYDASGKPARVVGRDMKDINESMLVYLLPDHLMYITINGHDKTGVSKLVEFFGKWSRKGDRLTTTTVGSNAEKRFKHPRIANYVLDRDWLGFKTSGTPYWHYKLVRRK